MGHNPRILSSNLDGRPRQRRTGNKELVVATIYVNSSAALTTALKAAAGGDVIKLAPGTYTGLSLGNVSYGSGVTITSADAANPAIITDFTLVNVQGVTFQNLEMLALDHPDYIEKGINFYAFKVARSSDVNFDDIHFHGSLDGNAQNDSLGLQIRDSSNVSVTNSEFEQLNRALAIGTTTGVRVSGNNVHDLRSDGFNFAQVKNAKIEDNIFHDFTPKAGDHPDAIQFWTSSTTAASTDILIARNVILRGDGEYTQGIFMRDETGVLPYERVTITENLIVGTGWSGLRVIGAKDLVVTNNDLISFVGDNVTFMLIQNADRVVATGNTAAQISFDTSTNVTQSGNEITKPVQDFGIEAVQDWMESRALTVSVDKGIQAAVGEARSLIAALPERSIHEHIVGTGKGDLLEGLDGNDTLEGGGGADTLAGGAGDDLYILPTLTSKIIENSGEGQDTIVAVGSFVLPVNVENLTIHEDGRGWRGTGNEQDNKLIGNSAGNFLDGAGGADLLDGCAGADTLVGGAGSDTLIGGDGADVFRFSPGGGKDVISDFGSGPGAESLNIYDYLKAGMTPTVGEVMGNAVISFANGDSITLLGIHAADLGAVSKYGWVI